MRVKPLLLIVVASLCVSCSHRTDRTVAAADATASDRVAGTKEWASEGARLRADKAEHARAGGVPAENAGDFAYLTSPIDIAGAGDYRVRIGPVDDEFNPPTSPTALALNKPSDATFDVVLTGLPTSVKDETGRYIELALRVTDSSAKYPSFTAWIY